MSSRLVTPHGTYLLTDAEARAAWIEVQARRMGLLELPRDPEERDRLLTRLVEKGMRVERVADRFGITPFRVRSAIRRVRAGRYGYGMPPRGHERASGGRSSRFTYGLSHRERRGLRTPQRRS